MNVGAVPAGGAAAVTALRAALLRLMWIKTIPGYYSNE